MKANILSLLVLPIAAIQAHQVPLRTSAHTPPFIQSSIFKTTDITTQHHVDEPVFLPPTYRARGAEAEYTFQGLLTFAHLEYNECTSRKSNNTFDIAIVGHPFDLGVSYRPGARFGPNGAREGARRLAPGGGWDTDHKGVNPFKNWAKVVDCGDIDNNPFEKLIAVKELEKGIAGITKQTPKNTTASDTVRIVSIGGDHTITLPILRALNKTWGPVTVLHFDSHLDTWDPRQLGGGLTKYAEVNHGTMLHIAHEEGLISNTSNMHLGTRCTLVDEHFDLNNDLRCGFEMVKAREIDVIGIKGVVERIWQKVKGQKVYLSVDIDVLDPAFAPATGTIEPGGWTTRELLAILSGLAEKGIEIVGADVVEFTPVYDNAAETTGIVVAQIVYEILQWMIMVPVRRQ